MPIKFYHKARTERRENKVAKENFVQVPASQCGE